MLTADAELDLRANPDQDAQGVAIEAHLDKGRGSGGDRARAARHAPGRRLDRLWRGLRPRPGDARRERRDRRRGRPVASGPGARSDGRAGRRRQLHRRRRRPDGPADRRAACRRASATPSWPQPSAAAPSRSCSRTSRRARSRSSSSSSRATSPVRSRPSRTRCSRSTSARRCSCGSSTAASARSPRTTSTSRWRPTTTPSSSASTSGPRRKARELADREGVDIRYYSVIYQAIEEVEAALKGMLKPEFEEVQLGTAEIREVFKVPQDRQHRRFDRPVRHDHPQQQGAAHPRRRRHRRQPHGRRRCAGSRTT